MNIIDQAADRLRGRWHQSGMGDIRGDGPVCGVGALCAVTGLKRCRQLVGEYPLQWAAIEEFLPDHGRMTFADFNDDPATTEEDVLLLLKKASALYDERQSAT